MLTHSHIALNDKSSIIVCWWNRNKNYVSDWYCHKSNKFGYRQKMQSVKVAFLVTSVLIKWVSRTWALSIMIRKYQFKCCSCEMICEEIVSDWEMVRYRVVPPNVGMHEGIVATKIMIFVTVISVYWSMISDHTW